MPKDNRVLVVAPFLKAFMAWVGVDFLKLDLSSALVAKKGAQTSRFFHG